MAKINRLNNISLETQPLKTAKLGAQYTSSTLLQDLQQGCIPLVAEKELDFGPSSNKEIFLRCLRFDNQEAYAIFVDLSDEPKQVCFDLPSATPRKWFDLLSKKRHSLITLVPPEVYHLINPWYDRKYETLFGARDGESAREAATALFELMDKAAQSAESGKELTEGIQKGEKVYFVDSPNSDGEPLELKFNPAHVESLAHRNREMATYLRRAFELVLNWDVENCQLNWGRCCQQAVNEIQGLTGVRRLDAKSGGRTVETWLRAFKEKRLFGNPLLMEQHGIAFFVNNQGSARRMREFGNNNLETLTIDKMRDYLMEVEVPMLIEERKKRNERGVTAKKLLKESGLTAVCGNTIHRWMKFLGFR